MELHQLRYFLAVAKHSNFSRAAEQCHVSQPSLSQQIQKLEEGLGEKLFNRLKRCAVLTAAGEALLPRATRIVNEVEAARHDVADASDLVRGHVSIGVLPTVAPYLLPRVLLSLARECPGIDVLIHEEPTARLIKMAGACEIDLAIVSLPIQDDRFVIESLLDEELLLALPHRHSLAARRAIRLSDLEGERFILMKEGHCLGDQALRFCERQDLLPSVAFRSAQLETIQALVSAGVGISLIPEMACRSARTGHPVYRSLAKPRPHRNISVIWHKEQHHSKAAREFLRILRQACRPKPSRPGKT
jgi:LysR family transcriptional regulator, hydrogen peroxide-inducible genes activator